MTRLFFAFLLVLLYSPATVTTLAPKEASALFHRFQFVMVSSKPGAVVAFRLANHNVRKKALLCFRGTCYRGLKRWQLLTTNSQIPGKQIVALVDATGGWTFRKIRLETNMWEQVHQKITPLRLPASVTKDIDEHAGLIPLNKAADEHLYSNSMKRPWSSRWIVPVRGAVTSEFGSLRVPPHGQPYAHTGVDFRASQGTAVHACSDGIVVGTDDEVLYGNVVTIDHGNGVMSRYMHLSSFNVNIGEVVKSGEVIGESGATGRAEAPHLHWEIRVRGQPVDPLSTRLLLARLSDLE